MGACLVAGLAYYWARYCTAGESMKQALVFLLISIAVISGCTVPDDAHVTLRHAKVYPLDNGVFEVAIPWDQNIAGFWCGASDYARRELRARATARIYVYRGLDKGVAADRRSTVLFTMTPPDSASGRQPWLMRPNAFDPGQNLSVSSADSRCDPYLLYT